MRPSICSPTGSMSGSERRRPIGRTEDAAKAAGLKPEQVYIHNAFVGGGFGRRDANDEVEQAIAIAKAVQRPVKLIWTREEDTRQDKFRPHAVVALQGRRRRRRHADGLVDARRDVVDPCDGRPAASQGQARAAWRSPGLADNGYNVPNMRVEAVIKNTHLPVWFWRAPGANQHVFAIESFLDEMAAAERPRSLPGAAQAARRQARLAQGAGYGRREGRLGQAVAEGHAAAASPSAKIPTASARRSPRSRSSRTAR